MKLKKIKFSNFRLFENLEIEFPDENFIVLIGGNGVGKTTILEGIARCIEHFVGIMTSALPKGHNIDTFLSDLDIKIGKITTLEKKYNAYRASRNLKNRNIYVYEYLFLVKKGL